MVNDPVVADTTPKTTFAEKSDDPGFLVSKGRFREDTEEERKAAEKKHVRKLASAIFMAMTNHGYARIRSIGARAAYNALRAVADASRHCAPKGIELVWKIAYDEGNIGTLRDANHVSDVSALVMEVRDWQSWSDNHDGSEKEIS